MVRRTALAVLILLFAGGCSVRKLAINQMGNAMAGTGTAFASDEDPELIGEALPFALKLIESLLAESPKHPGLLLAATSGFTQYSGGWVQQQAEEIREDDLETAMEMRTRARKLYLRARDYGLRGLATRDAGIVEALEDDPKGAVSRLGRRDVPLLYWTAAAWISAVSLSKDNPDLVADLPIIEAMIDRALQLDETFEGGAIHGFLIVYELNWPSATGDPQERARKHFDRTVELSGGHMASPFVTWAAQVSVPAQDFDEFKTLLSRALAVELNAKPEWRLANILAQREARRLLDNADDYFLRAQTETESEEETEPKEEDNEP